MIQFNQTQTRNLLKWAEWLDTTVLQQGKGALHGSDEEYCCLGIYVEYRNSRSWHREPGCTAYSVLIRGKGWTSSYLNIQQKQELGLHLDYRTDTLENIFVLLNDEREYSFKDIAQEIRHLVAHGKFTPQTEHQLFGCALRDLMEEERS